MIVATPMSRVLEQISRDHFPYPPATLGEIAAFESRVGWRLDPDLRAFYLHCNGAELFKRRPSAPYRILPLAKIIRARVAIRGEDSDQWGPPSMYAVCDMQDGNYVVMDVAQAANRPYPLFDGDHETWPDPAYCEQIAGSFLEFLEQALRSQGRSYWLAR
jgi:hypothetical protein